MRKHFKGISRHSTELTDPPVAAPSRAIVQPTLPEFIRVPTKGLCPWTGLSRSKFYGLISEGVVGTVCLRKRGAVRGTRLIHLRSLLNYLESQMKGGKLG